MKEHHSHSAGKVWQGRGQRIGCEKTRSTLVVIPASRLSTNTIFLLSFLPLPLICKENYAPVKIYLESIVSLLVQNKCNLACLSYKKNLKPQTKQILLWVSEGFNIIGVRVTLNNDNSHQINTPGHSLQPVCLLGYRWMCHKCKKPVFWSFHHQDRWEQVDETSKTKPKSCHTALVSVFFSLHVFFLLAVFLSAVVPCLRKVL